MATSSKRFRIEALPQQDYQILVQYDALYPGLLDYLEKNGKFPDDFGSKTGFSKGEVDLANQTLKNLPTAESAYRDYLKGQTGTETNLSDDELTNRLAAYQGLSGITTTQTVRDIPTLTSDLERTIRQKIKDADIGGLSDLAVQKAAELLANRIANGEGDNLDQNFAETFRTYGGVGKSDFGTLKRIGAELTTTTANAINSGGYMKTTTNPIGDFSPDVQRIQDLISGRANTKAEEAKVNSLQEEIPALMAAEREKYYGGERERAKDYITGYAAPQIIEQLNRRGLANSGEVPATIQNKYSELLGNIDAAELDQINSEMNYWAGQKYDTTFAQLLAAKTGVDNEIQSAREGAITTSAQNFTKAQQKIQDQFNLDLFRSENERALKQYNSQIQAKNKQIEDAKNAQYTSDAASAATTIAGLAMIG